MTSAMAQSGSSRALIASLSSYERDRDQMEYELEQLKTNALPEEFPMPSVA
jgi:hypothetical protein